MIQCGFKISEYPVGGSAPPTYRLRVFAVERGKVCLATGSRTPAPWSLGNSTMPIEEAPRGQLDHEDVTEAAEDILPCNALDLLEALPPRRR